MASTRAPPCLAARFPLDSLCFNFVLSAAQSSVKTLKSVSSACFSTILRAGTSSPRASRSRESYAAPCHPLSQHLHRYNPVIGEFFRCRYDYPNDTQGFFIAEQGGPPQPNLPNSSLNLTTKVFDQYRIIHLYPHSTTFHPRTKLPSSASSGQNPNSSATPSPRRWRARTA
jgi:hypothetical protein